MRTLLSPRPLRFLQAAMGAAVLVALSSCVDRDPLDPSRTGTLFSHYGDGIPLSGSGETNVLDGAYTSSDWADAAVVSFPVATSSGMTTARLRVMNNASHIFISARTDKPLSGSNQDVFTIRMEIGGKVNVFGLRFGTAFDEYCTLNVAGALTDCGTDTAAGNAIGQRIGAGGGTTYEVSFPRADDVNGQDINMTTDGIVANIQVSFEPANASTTTWPGTTSWARAQMVGESTTPDDRDDVPNATVTVVGACPVTVIMRSEDDYRLQVAQCTSTSTNVGTTTFVDVQPGSKPVYSALGAEIFNLAAQRDVAPSFLADLPLLRTLPTLEAHIFIHSSTGGYSAGRSERAIPLFIEEAYQSARAVPLVLNNGIAENLSVIIQLAAGNLRTITCTVNGTSTAATVHAVYPLNPSKVYPSFDINAPGYSPFVDQTNTSGGDCVSVVANDELTVLTGQNQTKQKFNTLIMPGESSATLYQIGDYYHSQYVLDPWGDGRPDIGLLTYGALNDGNGNEGNWFSANWKVRGLVTNKKGDSFSRWLLEVIVGTETIKVTVYCRKDGACAAQTIEPKGWNSTSMVQVSGSVNGSGHGYAQVNLNFTGINEARFRVRTADNDAGGDFAPNDGLTQSPNIESGYALWTRGTTQGTSWKLTF